MPRLTSPIRRLTVVLLAGVVIAVAGCVNIFWRTDVRPLKNAMRPLENEVVSLRSPVKAHLADGSTVVFARGAFVDRARIQGSGFVYPLLSDTGHAVDGVPMDSVVGLEAFEGKVLMAPTIVASAAATALGTLATAALAVAIFGSCPTVYVDTGAGPQLVAEGFSYAVAPLFEHRDLDAIPAKPDRDGVVRLELRNEALETHLINHLELVAVRHERSARMLPDQASRPVVVSDVRPLTRATDRAGRDVRGMLAAADGQLFSSHPAVVAAARAGDLDDWIDLDADGLAPGDSLAVVLRLRNSLLNTILLYDGMLGGRDAANWLGNDLQNIATAVDLTRWYTRTMGMRATVDGSHESSRLNDIGPIAFRDVAIVLPRHDRNATHVRVRLQFVADNWRIDQAAVASRVSRPSVRTLAVERIVVPHPHVGDGPVLDSAGVRALAAPDDRYLETSPGQRMILEFHAGDVASADSATSFAIAWQGWYREWIRGSTMSHPVRTTPFVPGDSAVLTALRRWSARRVEFERAFYSSRISTQ